MRTFRTQIKIGAGAVLVGLAVMLTLVDARATFPGDNGLISWSSGGDLWRANPDGTNPVQITTLGGDQPAWSPKSADLEVTFTRQISGKGDIFKMLADASATPANLAADPADDRQPTFSPDGSQIVFASDRSGAYRLYRMPSAGGAATAITTTGALPAGTDDDAPEWNFTNDRIVFQRGVPGGLGDSVGTDALGNTAIYSIKADGTDIQRLTSGTSPSGGIYSYTKLVRPKWSPDGTKIVFASESSVACASRLFIMSANGSGPVAVSKPGDACEVSDPGWSPNGQLLIFKATSVDLAPSPTATQADDVDGLFGLNPSNSQFSQLSNQAGASAPDWGRINGPAAPTTTSTSTSSTTVPGATTTTTSTTTTTTTTVPPAPTTGGGGSRIGVINSCSSLHVKEGFVTNGFQQQLQCGDGRMVALADTRTGVVNACGSFYVKQGALSGPFNQQTGCGDTQAIAVAANRIGVINGCGAGYVKDGALTGPFSLQLNCGDARAVVVTDARLGVINSCGAAYVKEGALTNSFNQQLNCGDARAIAVSPNRVAVINSCGAVYVKEGALTNPFQLQLNCGDGRAVAITDNRVGIINSCGAMWVKEGALTNGFTQQTQCADAQAIAIAANRVAVINGCGAAYVKEGVLSGPFSRQLVCGDARAVALNGT